MTDQDRVALTLFRNLMRLWGCSTEQQIRILGSADQAQLDHWQAAGLPRDALLLIEGHFVAVWEYLERQAVCPVGHP